MALSQLDHAKDGSRARNFGGFILAKALAANVSETLTVPTGATRVIFSATADFYAEPFTTAVADLVANGAFATDTAWTKGTGWTIAAGVATATGAISTTLTQTPSTALVAGKAYRVIFTVSGFAAGTVTPTIGGTAGTARGSDATFDEIIIATAAGTVGFATSGFTGNVDNFSVTPIANVPVDESNGAASELIKAASDEVSRTRICTGLASIAVVAPATTILTASFFY